MASDTKLMEGQMFNNLVESGSRPRETRRRVAFFVGSFVGYAILIVLVGVASILMVDAQVDAQALELQALVTPVEFINVPQPPRAPNQPPPPGGTNNRPPQIQQVTEAVAPISVPIAPPTVGVKASPVPPVSGPYKYGPTNIPASGMPEGPGSGKGTVAVAPTSAIVLAGEPPPAAAPAPTPAPTPPQVIRKSGGVLNGEALTLPPPLYPPMARTARAMGDVIVEVLINEDGKVIRASAKKGHPLLLNAAVEAAKKATFSPTKLSGNPVKVEGTITYKFVL